METRGGGDGVHVLGTTENTCGWLRQARTVAAACIVQKTGGSDWQRMRVLRESWGLSMTAAQTERGGGVRGRAGAERRREREGGQKVSTKRTGRPPSSPPSCGLCCCCWHWLGGWALHSGHTVGACLPPWPSPPGTCRTLRRLEHRERERTITCCYFEIRGQRKTLLKKLQPWSECVSLPESYLHSSPLPPCHLSVCREKRDRLLFGCFDRLHRKKKKKKIAERKFGVLPPKPIHPRLLQRDRNTPVTYHSHWPQAQVSVWLWQEHWRFTLDRSTTGKDLGLGTGCAWAKVYSDHYIHTHSVRRSLLVRVDVFSQRSHKVQCTTCPYNGTPLNPLQKSFNLIKQCVSILAWGSMRSNGTMPG